MASATFEEGCLALAHADAEGREAVPAAATPELVQQAHDETGAAHPERVAERDRAAVHVDALGIEAELADHDQALRGEGLVQLDEVDVGDGDARAREQLLDRRDRADPHHARVDTRDGRADEGAEWLDAELARALVARD